MRSAAFIIALLALSGTLLVVPAGAAQSPTATTPRLDDGTALRPQFESPGQTTVVVSLRSNGSARWTVSHRYQLDTENETTAFRTLGTEFEDGEADVGLDAAFFERIASLSSNATGREMAIQNVSRTATVTNGTGTLNVSFTWTNFLEPTAQGYELRGAVMMPNNRTWLSTLGENQELRVVTPPGYRVVSTQYGLENGSVVISGPTELEQPLSVTYRETGGAGPDSGTEMPWTLVGGAVVVGALAVGAFLWYRRRAPAGETGESTGAGEPAAASAGDGGTKGVKRGDETPPSATETAAESVTSAAEEEEGKAAEPGPEPEVDVSLLSDEERIEYLLEQNGGRMKQAQIVRETGWSDAKVSQLLSSMADEGRVEKLRIGRENLISLPDAAE